MAREPRDLARLLQPLLDRQLILMLMLSGSLWLAGIDGVAA